MPKVNRYEIIDLGIDNSDHFQGFGTTSTDFDAAAHGRGNSEKEALEQAAEDLVQQGWELSQELENEINSASEKDIISEELAINGPSQDATFVVKHFSNSMGSELDSEEFESLEEAQTYAQERVKRLEGQGFEVSELEPGMKWELTEGDDAAMVPDESGIISISDDSEEKQEAFDKYMEQSDIAIYMGIRVAE